MAREHHSKALTTKLKFIKKYDIFFRGYPSTSFDFGNHLYTVRLEFDVIVCTVDADLPLEGSGVGFIHSGSHVCERVLLQS